MLEEKHHQAAVRRRGRSRGSVSRPSVDPGGRDNQGTDVSPCASEQKSTWCGGGAREGSLSDDGGADEGMSDRGDEKMTSVLGCEGAMAVVGTKSVLEKAVPPSESSRTLGETARYVSDMEARILPRDASDDGASLTANRARAEGQPIPESRAPRAGGGFARLVVVKELQPVPEHAPEDARHLLELALDHQQVICVLEHCLVNGSMDELTAREESAHA